MTTDEIKELRTKLDEYRHAYYNTDKSLVPDVVYDTLLEEVEELEQSIGLTTERPVGAVINSNEGIIHSRPMLSLRDVNTRADVKKWLEGILNKFNEPIKITLEHKYDGLALSLVFKDGDIIQATTRGDGLVGENVISQVNVYLDYLNLPDGEWRGEFVVSKEDFNNFNTLQDKPYATERHLAVALLRSKDTTRFLDVIASFQPYDVIDDTLTISDKLAIIEKELPANKYLLGVYSYPENESILLDSLDFFEKIRGSNRYLTDGLVLKVDSPTHRKLLGEGNHHPNWALAYKFKNKGAWSHLRKVEWQVSRTGKLSPVGIIDPVEVGGVMLAKVSLHNPNFMRKMNLGLGGRVYVERAGDVIPKITYSETGVVIPEPKKCPSCNTTIRAVYKGNQIDYFCYNEECVESTTAKLKYIYGKGGFNVKGLGDVFLNGLLKTTVGNILHTESYLLYEILTKHKDQILKESQLTNHAIDNATHSLMNAFDYDKRYYLTLKSLCLPNIGNTKSKSITENMTIDEELFEYLNETDLSVIEIAKGYLQLFERG